MISLGLPRKPQQQSTCPAYYCHPPTLSTSTSKGYPRKRPKCQIIQCSPHSHASPHPSSISSSSAFFLASSSFLFFSSSAFVVAADFLTCPVTTDFLAPAAVPALPVELARGPAPGLLPALADDFADASPLGSGFLIAAFACACAVSQPAKSGSPLSSKGTAAASLFVGAGEKGS